ncbi:hypothetical protein L546_0496 [Bordetella pertussis H897]|nr:hypothetical protein L569_0501 [Bordetella pertussis 2250905]ETH33364.1 hypothetical protein L546_0496 [Bordetella pertussis H897]ETH95183.1 hypothetical protein L562_0505 [Bordetella pertussis STO1-CHOC-0021]
MGLRSHLPELPTPSRCHEILATPLQLASTPPRHRARCTHLQTQPGRIQPIDSSQLATSLRSGRRARVRAGANADCCALLRFWI